MLMYKFTGSDTELCAMAVKFLDKVLTASIECERANEAAEDILRDEEKLKFAHEKITGIDKILNRRESLMLISATFCHWLSMTYSAVVD